MKGKIKNIWTIVVLVMGTSAAFSHADEVSGFVFDEVTMNPIEGALVSLQASGIQTITAPDGSYTLDIPGGNNLVIVSARKGYFNRSVLVNTPATGVQILLQQVPQDDDPNYTLLSPAMCGLCHPDQFDQWNDTAMANAGFNTWVADIYNGSGTPGGLGGFVYVRDSVFAETNPASECASCHQPEHWIANPFSPMVDPQPPLPPSVVHGVSCDVCHKIADVDESKINFPGIFPGAVTFTRPQGPEFHQVEYGVLGDVDYTNIFLMRASYQPQLVAEVCAACHQDAADPNEDHSYTGVISEPTYLEWAATPYADPDSPLYADCVTCHMPPSGETNVCTVLFPPLERDPETIRSHRIEGTTPLFLENAVELTMQAQLAGRELRVDVAIDNSQTGHHVPTGVTVRNMILLVEAWLEGNDPLTDPLPFTGTQTVHELGGVGDPAQGYYAGLPGRFYAVVNHDAQGNSPTFFTDATGILFDNRIPALTTDLTNYTFEIPDRGGTLHVRARLIYRRAFRFLVDAKQWIYDGHDNPLEDVTPPHFGHLMEFQEQTLFAPPIVGACCLPDGGCMVQTEQDCNGLPGRVWAGDQTNCADGDMNGTADVCEGPMSVPTVSQWGLVILALLLLTAGKVYFGLRNRVTE